MEKIKYSAVICFKSDLDIQDVGEILSNYLLGGLKFGGLEECIHEEIPAIYIDCAIMGLQIILDGSKEGHYCLDFGFSPLVDEYVDDDEYDTFAFFNRGFEQYLRKLLKFLPEITLI